MATLYQVPTQDSLQYTLDAAYATSDTTLTLNQTVTNIIQAPGVCVIDRVDASGNATPTKRDYFTFTGVSGTQLTGVVGGKAGSTNQAHSVGAIVEFIPDIVWAQALYDVITAEHNTNGSHSFITASSASINVVNTRLLAVASGASIFDLEANKLGISSQASVGFLNIGTFISASGASVVGFPASTGGFNALFQVPGALASLANVGGLIPVPTTFTAQFIEAFVQTPASLASVSANILKNNSVIGVVGILAGATYGSSASLSATALTATDELRMNINSTASSATDLSVLLRAT